MRYIAEQMVQRCFYKLMQSNKLSYSELLNPPRSEPGWVCVCVLIFSLTESPPAGTAISRPNIQYCGAEPFFWVGSDFRLLKSRSRIRLRLSAGTEQNCEQIRH